jgi:hypothetical protein
MPHGELLAHARLKGTPMADEHGAVVPSSGYAWQDHGRDGVAAVKSILLNLGCYPKMIMQVASLTPPAVPTQAQRNIVKQEQAFPSVDWTKVALIRGVELWMDDAQVLEEYAWEVLQGGPTVSDLPTCSVQCPVVMAITPSAPQNASAVTSTPFTTLPATALKGATHDRVTLSCEQSSCRMQFAAQDGAATGTLGQR